MGDLINPALFVMSALQYIITVTSILSPSSAKPY